MLFTPDQVSFASVRVPDFRLPVLYLLTDFEQVLLFQEKNEAMSQRDLYSNERKLEVLDAVSKSMKCKQYPRNVNHARKNANRKQYTMVTTLDQFSPPPNQKQPGLLFEINVVACKM